MKEIVLMGLKMVLEKFGNPEALTETTEFGSVIFAEKPGDGSAREQAASCQRVLGGRANIVREYATKRYRSNCINWGIIPFVISKETPFDYLFISKNSVIKKSRSFWTAA